MAVDPCVVLAFATLVDLALLQSLVDRACAIVAASPYCSRPVELYGPIHSRSETGRRLTTFQAARGQPLTPTAILTSLQGIPDAVVQHVARRSFAGTLLESLLERRNVNGRDLSRVSLPALIVLVADPSNASPTGVMDAVRRLHRSHRLYPDATPTLAVIFTQAAPEEYTHRLTALLSNVHGVTFTIEAPAVQASFSLSLCIQLPCVTMQPVCSA